MKSSTVSIFSITNGKTDGFQPEWKGGRGDELDHCPFSFNEDRNSDAESSDTANLQFIYRDTDSGFNGQNLEGADFSGDQLARVDFSYANLRMVDCRNTNLQEANFRFSDLTFADLDFAMLTSVDFSYADLCKASLRGALLRFANLTGADLEHADFLEADLRGAVFTEADCRNTNFAGALFDGTTVLPFAKEEAARRGMIESPILRDGTMGVWRRRHLGRF